ncbi:hypothetical protein ACLMAJ_03065 [Nocardia sp. KC 131]|uniref:hypothetical protein n=1 Tax=Nocardia arseniciresistens TaxID=3392119 RepID=UPI00398ECC34
MVQPTPWKTGRTQQAQTILPSQTTGGTSRRQVDVTKVVAWLKPHLAVFRGHWGYLFAAVGNIITLFGLFEPWVDASSTDGRITATPFGKFQISSSLVALWSGAPPPTAKINGMWAVLACIAVVITVSAAMINLRARTQALSALVMGSTVAVSLFLVFALVHMNNKLPDLRAMVGNASARDLGSQVGMLMRWASGNGNYALPGLKRYTWTTASLTTWAWLAGGMAVISAIAAIAQWVRSRPDGPIAIPLRMPIVITRASDDHASEQPSPDPAPAAASPPAAPEAPMPPAPATPPERPPTDPGHAG